MNGPAIIFETREYRSSHLREPRGRGSWAFRHLDETIWSPSMTYGEAKRWARAEWQARRPTAGTIIVYVLP